MDNELARSAARYHTKSAEMCIVRDIDWPWIPTVLSLVLLSISSWVRTSVLSPPMRMFWLSPHCSTTTWGTSLRDRVPSSWTCLKSKGPFNLLTWTKLIQSHREPEIFSCILEFLYKGDYYPRMFRSKRSGNWCLENAQEDSETGGNGSSEPTFLHPGVGDVVLRDSVVYCAAGKYGLERLKRLALRKQGLQTGISADVLLRSARYTYENTPPTDDGLRVYYLAHIIRNRRALKQSTTMHTEMQKGGTLFFDLFVAMCNAMDDTVEIRYVPFIHHIYMPWNAESPWLTRENTSLLVDQKLIRTSPKRSYGLF